MYDNKPIIIIADDHLMFAESLLFLLKKEMKDFDFTHVQRGDNLLTLMNRIKVALVVLDIKMPGIDGVKALELIKRNHPKTKVIILSTYSETETVNSCYINGADAFLMKNVSIELLIKTINKVLNSSSRPIEKWKSGNNQKYLWISQNYKITPREWDILQWIKTGATNQKISEMLKISIYTTDTHRKNIMQKLRLKTPAELIKFFIEHDL